MPRKKYALEKNGPKEIEISWGFAWKNFTVRQNEQIIGTAGSQQELKDGCQFRLLDGTELSVRLNLGIGKTGLEVLRDGKPLPGSDSDPEQKIKLAFGILLFVAAVNMAGGIIVTAIFPEFLFVGILIMFYGLLFAGLAMGVKKHLFAALIIAIGLLIADALAGLFFQALSHYNVSIAWIILRIVFLIYLFQSVKAMRQIKNR